MKGKPMIGRFAVLLSLVSALFQVGCGSTTAPPTVTPVSPPTVVINTATPQPTGVWGEHQTVPEAAEAEPSPVAMPIPSPTPTTPTIRLDTQHPNQLLPLLNKYWRVEKVDPFMERRQTAPIQWEDVEGIRVLIYDNADSSKKVLLEVLATSRAYTEFANWPDIPFQFVLKESGKGQFTLHLSR